MCIHQCEWDKNKKTSLKVIMESTECDIMFIDETKVYSEADKPTVDGYSTIQETRDKNIMDPSDKPGGGIAVLVKNDLTKIRSEKIKVNQNKDIMAISISTKNKPIYFIQGYAPQSNNTEEADKFFKDLDEYIDELKKLGDTYIIGDLNAHMQINNEEKNIKQEVNRSGKILKDIIEKRNLQTCFEKFPEEVNWTRVGTTQATKNQKSIMKRKTLNKK